MSDDDDEGWDVFESAVGSSRFSSVESDRFSGSNTFRGRASTTGRERASTATRRWRSSTVDDPHVSDEERGQVLALLGKAQPPPYGIFWVDKVQEKSGGKHAQKRMLAIGAAEVLSIKRGSSGTLQVQRRGQLFNIESYGHVKGGGDVVSLHFSEGFVIAFNVTSSRDVDVLRTLDRALTDANFGRAHMMPVVARRTKEMLKSDEDEGGVSPPVQSHPASYLANCCLRKLEPRVAVIQHLKAQLSSVTAGSTPGADRRVLSLSACFPKKTRHEQLLCLEPMLRASPWFDAVVVRRTAISALGVEYLVHAVAANPAVKQLAISGAGLLGEKHLHSLVTFGPHLTHLDLSHNRIGDKGAAHLARALQGLEAPPPPKAFDSGEARPARAGGCTLQVLKLSGCELNASALARLRVFLQSRAWARSLHTLELSECPLGSKGTEIIESFVGNSRALKTLRIADCSLSTTPIFNALASNEHAAQSLTLLDASGNGLDSMAGEALGDFLQVSMSIRGLLLRRTSPDAQSLRFLLSKACSNIHNERGRHAESRDESFVMDLDLSENKFGTSHVDSIARTLSSVAMRDGCFPFRQLLLNDCSLGPKGVATLCDALSHCAPRALQSLSFERNCHLGLYEKMSGTSAFRELSSSLAFAITTPGFGLRALYLAGDGNQHTLSEFLPPAVVALARNTTLQVLDVRNNKAGAELGHSLGKALAANSTLLELQVDGNQLGVAGLRALGAGLDRNETLAFFPMPEHDVSAAHAGNASQKTMLDDVVESIAEVIAHNLETWKAARRAEGHGSSRSISLGHFGDDDDDDEILAAGHEGDDDEEDDDDEDDDDDDDDDSPGSPRAQPPPPPSSSRAKPPPPSRPPRPPAVIDESFSERGTESEWASSHRPSPSSRPPPPPKSSRRPSPPPPQSSTRAPPPPQQSRRQPPPPRSRPPPPPAESTRFDEQPSSRAAAPSPRSRPPPPPRQSTHFDEQPSSRAAAPSSRSRPPPPPRQSAYVDEEPSSRAAAPPDRKPPPPAKAASRKPPAPAPTAAAPDPRMEKYSKMLRMGLPEGAVVLKMQADGIDAASIAAFTNQAAPTPSMDRQPSSRADAPPPRRPPPPRASLSQPAAARSPPPPAPEAAAPDPRMQKYSKMLRMGLPAGAVALKMQADGIDAATIAAFTDQNSGGGAAPAQNATQRAAVASASRRALKRTEPPARAPPPQPQASGATQDPRYVKFAKMLKMGLPAGAVAHKMRAEGVDESTIAAITGEAPLASGGGGSAAPQSRPAPALSAGGGALSLRSQIRGGTQLKKAAPAAESRPAPALGAGGGALSLRSQIRAGAQLKKAAPAAESRPAPPIGAGGGALSLRSQIKAGAKLKKTPPAGENRPAPPLAAGGGALSLRSQIKAGAKLKKTPPPGERTPAPKLGSGGGALSLRSQIKAGGKLKHVERGPKPAPASDGDKAAAAFGTRLSWPAHLLVPTLDLISRCAVPAGGAVFAKLLSDRRKKVEMEDDDDSDDDDDDDDWLS